jgi:Uncharacterized protein conserved in bacteria
MTDHKHDDLPLTLSSPQTVPVIDVSDDQFARAMVSDDYPVTGQFSYLYEGPSAPVSNFQSVLEFHRTYGQLINKTPQIPSDAVVALRLELIDEEFKELQEAIAEGDIVGVADALTDILYVVYGAGATFGIDLDATYKEVHRSNMSKLDESGKPIYREDGKVLKGKNYSPPDLKSVLDNSTLSD